MPNFRDFDAFLAEAQERGPSFRLFGETWHLPPSLPVALMTKAALMQATLGDDAEIDPSSLLDMASAIFGKDALDAWIEKGLDVDTLTELIGWVPEAYSPQSDEETDPGN